ncbi:sulfotransferase domain-containing protein [Thermodesulfatator autotrophicus]|nr:sulfotransferase domain-containing protein [Thermodesulfatator autotrophicus]
MRQKHKQYLPDNPMHDDIYIVEFPKSGITWLQHILGNIELQLAGKKREFISFYNHHKYLPDVHQLRGANINRFLNRTFIKSHAEYNPFYYFVIYLIRNPFDVMVSYYNFLLHMGESYKNFKKFVKSEKGIKAWKRHVLSWWYRKVDAQRIHFIKYEDLLKNPVHEISELYKNLGVNVEKEIIEESVERSKMEKMRASEEHYRKYNPNYSMSFVGKRGKIKKEQFLTDEVGEYILQETKEIIEFFYPELVKDRGTP